MGIVWIILIITATVTANPRPVTNEDIRDAILSVVHMIRNTEDKLERHEYRERALGDQVKKALTTIDKRQKLMEPIKGTLGRLDERLATVETILMQKEERQQKTTEILDEMQKKIPQLLDKLKNDIKDQLQGVNHSDLEQIQKEISSKIDNATKNTLQQLSKLNEGKTNDSTNLTKTLENNSKLLEKFENKLAEYQNNIQPPEKLFETKLLQEIDLQHRNIEQILTDMKTVNGKVEKLPDNLFLQDLHNITLKTIEEVKDESIKQSDRTVALLDEKLQKINKHSSDQHEEVNKSVGELLEITDTLNGNIAHSYDQLKENIQGLGKLEQVMVQTADGVLDTKRRVEYGVHQILLEIGDLIKGQNKEINTAISDRFDLFEMSILDEETGALANLTSKIGHEIDQVWRQIGIMHQQMSATTDTLNRLQNQTDSYVNGSLNSMDNMKGKVGQITSRMSEVDDNLNYLLGRLSLVTQEFNQIKTGLGNALDEIKGSFQTVQKKIEDKGPGPHKIPGDSDEKNDIK